MNSEEIEDCLNRIAEMVAKSNGILNYKRGPTETIAEGQCFTSEIFMFTITLYSTSSEQELNLLLKHVFKEEDKRKRIPLQYSFQNEIYFYEKIFPSFDKFRELHGCPKEYDLVPECYETSVQSQKQCLLFDNLRHQGFSTIDNQLDFTSDHVELIFKVCGYFHAQSLAFKEKNPNRYSNLVKGISHVNNTILRISPLKDNIIWIVHEIRKTLEPGKDDVLIKKFEKYVDDPTSSVNISLNKDKKFAALIHGDCWSNNLLFKYDELGKPVDMRLIDWQILNTGSPVCDLSYALYSDGTKSNLDKLGDYLKIYYNSLSSTLVKFGCDPDTTFPFSELERQWKLHAKYGFIFGSLMMRRKCIKSRNLNKIVHESDHLYQGEEYDVPRFLTKIRDIINNMHDSDAL